MLLKRDMAVPYDCGKRSGRFVDRMVIEGVKGSTEVVELSFGKK